jgi:hypothetical protein
MADSDMNFSGALKIPDKSEKFGATVKIDSMSDLSAGIFQSQSHERPDGIFAMI